MFVLETYEGAVVLTDLDGPPFFGKAEEPVQYCWGGGICGPPFLRSDRSVEPPGPRHEAPTTDAAAFTHLTAGT